MMGYLPPNLAQVVAQLREGLNKLYGDRFRDLLLYGSYARGDFREGSDVDLLLLLDGQVDTVEEIHRIQPIKWPLALANDAVLTVIPVSFESYRRAETFFLRSVQKEAVSSTPPPTAGA
jgi:predicted nucleotidyltransferase